MVVFQTLIHENPTNKVTDEVRNGFMRPIQLPSSMMLLKLKCQAVRVVDDDGAAVPSKAKPAC